MSTPPSAKDDVSAEDAALIRSSLRELASCADTVVRRVATVEVPEVSPAYSQWLGIVELLKADGQAMFTRGHNSVILAILAAVDHIKSFTGSISRPGTTISTATLTRGALEALSKAFYLLSAENPREFLQRYVALQEYEFNTTEDSEYQHLDGSPVDGKANFEQLRNTLTKHDIHPLKTGRGGVALTGMVHALLDASADLDAGLSRKLYAQLCGIAHTNTSAAAMYVDDQGDGPRLRLPRELAFEQAGMNLATLVVVLDRYLNHHLPSPGVRDRWESAKARAQEPLVHLKVELP